MIQTFTRINEILLEPRCVCLLTLLSVAVRAPIAGLRGCKGDCRTGLLTPDLNSPGNHSTAVTGVTGRPKPV